MFLKSQVYSKLYVPYLWLYFQECVREIQGLHKDYILVRLYIYFYILKHGNIYVVEAHFMSQ